MEQFTSNYVRNCKELGISPSNAVLDELSDHKAGKEGSTTELILDLSGNSLSVQDCAVLAKTLANDRFIEEIRFSDCLLTEEACKLLLNYVSSNKTLRRLDFKGNNIRSAGELVGRILKRTTTLSHLSLEWNAIGLWDLSLVSIAEGLQVNQTLRYLDLRNNQISHEGGMHIANALKTNTVLKVLDLRWNNIGLLGARAFLATLKHNKEIIKLDLAGNNVPSEMMKAIESSLRRNVDCQASCEAQKALTVSYKNQLENIESQKNSQISSLVDKLAREKENYDNSTRSAQEKIEQLKEALDERRSAFSTLQERYSAIESSLNLSQKANKQQQETNDNLKTEIARKDKEHSFEVEKLREQLDLVEKTHKAAIKVTEDENISLRKKNNDLTSEIEKYRKTLEGMEKMIREKEMNHHDTLKENDKKFSNEIDRLVEESNARKQNDSEKYQKLEHANYRLEEEVSQLKSKLITEKLKSEEDLMNLKMTLKQEEMNRGRQYEERIELLQSSRNEMQIRNTKHGAEIAELQSRLSNYEHETDSLKRQCEHLKQQIDNRDAEHRNEANKAKLELDNEKRMQMQLQSKISELELKTTELEKRAKNDLLVKESEILQLRSKINSKEDEIVKHRNDEMKRTELLEHALQEYISSAKKLR